MHAPTLRHPLVTIARRRLSPRRILLALAGLRAERRALSRLDDRLLADIGLTPDAARIESERPLWDVPAHWRA